MNLGIIGLGIVGSAMHKSFIDKEILNLCVYDKYKKIGNLDDISKCDVIFIALPTEYDKESKDFNLNSFYEIFDYLNNKIFNGIIVIKSTVIPGTTEMLAIKYNKFQFVYNPEFLTAKTAYNDFHNQKHIILGKNLVCSNEKIETIIDFYKKYYSDAEISLCSSTEAEMTKIFINSFYATKVQFFTELYLACQKNSSNYNKIRDMIIKNKWINPMHTIIPGPDGKVSYGGGCFPKDISGLLSYMEKIDSPYLLLKACIDERNIMRT